MGKTGEGGTYPSRFPFSLTHHSLFFGDQHTWSMPGVLIQLLALQMLLLFQKRELEQ